MALDITAFSRARFVAPKADNDYEEHEEEHVYVYAVDWPERLDGREPGWYAVDGDAMHFRAGSYSGYNHWREQLCAAALGVHPKEVWEDPASFDGRPFVELINFADNEGAIGPKTSAKLLADFQRNPDLPGKVVFVFQGAYGQHDGRSFPADAAPLHTVTTTHGDGLVCPPLVVNSNHDDNRAFPAGAAPLATRSTKIGEAVVTPPFITMLRSNNRATLPADEPMATLATGNHHYLTIPPGAFYMKNFTPRGNPGQMCKDVRTDPFGSITSVDHHALVVPYRRGRAKSSSEPLLTLGTRDSAGLCSIETVAEDCYYRMLKPREHLRGQRFRDDYEVKGNLGEQTMQAGNAVPCNVAQWIGSKLAAVL
jgi:hypothetical protein